MKLNDKGFTLIELLASMVILAAIMVIAVPNIMGILNNSKADAYVEDAKKLLSLAEYKINGKTDLRPSSGCTKLTLKYLDNSEFENAPNNGSYDKKNSFVTVTYQGIKGGKKQYSYTVTIVEKMEGGGTRGIANKTASELFNQDPSKLVKNNPSVSGSCGKTF